MTHTPGSAQTASPTGKPPRKIWLYLPFILFALICAAYTGYWFFVKGKLDDGVNDFIAQQRAAGAELTYSEKHLGGFPFRFALTVDDLTFANPEAGFDWKAEKLQINMQPWNFFHAIFRSSGRNEIALANGQDYTAILGKKSALSLNWDSENIREAGLSLDTADIVGAFGDVGLKNFKASYLDAGTGITGKRILIDWDGVTLADSMIAGTDAEILGTELQASRLRLQGEGFGVFGEAEERKLEIAQLLFNWGPLKLGSKGKFDITDEGHLDGTLNLRLDDAETLGELLKENGLYTMPLSFLHTSIAAASKDESNFYKLPFRNGKISILGTEYGSLPPIAPPLTAAPPSPAE